MDNLDFAFLAGYRVIENRNLVDWIEPEKNWVDKVLEWNPCNPWRKPRIPKPSPVTYIVNGCLVAHPAIIAELKKAT